MVEEGDGAARGRAQPLAELFLPGLKCRLVTAAGGAVQVVPQMQGQEVGKPSPSLCLLRLGGS